jgi:hypothetical protein
MLQSNTAFMHRPAVQCKATSFNGDEGVFQSFVQVRYGCPRMIPLLRQTILEPTCSYSDITGVSMKYVHVHIYIRGMHTFTM